MTSIPVVIGPSGAVPTPPATIRTNLLAAVSATNPGYTADLPGSLIEDVSSTDVAAIAQCDQAYVELVNSLTPYGANAFLLVQLGNVYGVPQGQPSNTSVYAMFTALDTGGNPLPGFIIAQGFVVSDGTYQYAVQDGGVTGSNGSSVPLYCLALLAGTWAVPAGTVTQLVTSVPSTVQLSVTNPEPGTPGTGQQSEASYRAAVLQAGLAASTGMTRYLKTLLGNVSGVQDRLISVRTPATGEWEVIVGGGDPYEVANAIFEALFDISSLVGSQLKVVGITNATAALVTTDLDHNYSSGQLVEIEGVIGLTGAMINGVPYTATIISETEFTIPVDTVTFPAYVSGGVVTPNLRNVTVSIYDPPDTYPITFVNPPQQVVTMTVLWNTTSMNVVSDAAMAQLGAPALAVYVNSVAVGQPMNLFELQTTFQTAVASILTPALLTRMKFEVAINGVGVEPETGTGIIAGDPESYFYTDPAGSGITVTQG